MSDNYSLAGCGSGLRTIFSNKHSHHAPQAEFNRGRIIPPYECPRRADEIKETLQRLQVGPIDAAEEFALDYIDRVHSPDYVKFLQTAYLEWISLGRSGDATPLAWPIRGMRSDRVPESIDGKLSYYSFDGASPVMAGTWDAAKAAVDVVLTATYRILNSHEQSVFALCRPPGHHAATDYYGGYCFLNNAAIAAQYLRDNGVERVGILDIDYHHGNGTQQIFYDRNDVLFASVHADPAMEYPYFLGYADETGAGKGEGFNFNYPLCRGADWGAWNNAFVSACKQLSANHIDAVVVSLGVDTYDKDPLGTFRLNSDHYLRIGKQVAQLRKPTLFVMEGGYAVEEIGINVANVLTGFDDN